MFGQSVSHNEKYGINDMVRYVLCFEWGFRWFIEEIHDTQLLMRIIGQLLNVAHVIITVDIDHNLISLLSFVTL